MAIKMMRIPIGLAPEEIGVEQIPYETFDEVTNIVILTLESEQVVQWAQQGSVHVLQE